MSTQPNIIKVTNNTNFLQMNAIRYFKDGSDVDFISKLDGIYATSEGKLRINNSQSCDDEALIDGFWVIWGDEGEIFTYNHEKMQREFSFVELTEQQRDEAIQLSMRLKFFVDKVVTGDGGVYYRIDIKKLFGRLLCEAIKQDTTIDFNLVRTDSEFFLTTRNISPLDDAPAYVKIYAYEHDEIHNELCTYKIVLPMLSIKRIVNFTFGGQS